jgi:hypothetical protein
MKRVIIFWRLTALPSDVLLAEKQVPPSLYRFLSTPRPVQSAALKRVVTLTL